MTHEHDYIVSQLIAATLNDQTIIQPHHTIESGEHACNDINWTAYQRPTLTLKGSSHGTRHHQD